MKRPSGYYADLFLRLVLMSLLGAGLVCAMLWLINWLGRQ